MRIKTLILTILALVLVGAGLAGGWFYLAKGRLLLAGEASHDFGEVAVEGRNTAVTHTFTLTNKAASPVTIVKIEPNCTCVQASATAMEVAPGDSIDLEASLRLDRGGKKTGRVKLILTTPEIEASETSEPVIQTIWLYATGMKDYLFYANQSEIPLEKDSPTPLVVFCEVQKNDDKPPAPTAETPDGVTATFVDWEQTRTTDSQSGTAKWRGRFSVVRTADDLPVMATMRLKLATEEVELFVQSRKSAPGAGTPGRALPRPTSEPATPRVTNPGG